MGVGAVFISTLALHKLPSPSNPPQSQQDILALAIPSVISFVVLSSIIIRASVTNVSFLSSNSPRPVPDGLSIPLFNLGKVLAAIPTTRSESKTNPDWPTHPNLSRITSQETTVDVLPNVPVDEVEKGDTRTSASRTRTETSQKEHEDSPDLEEIIVNNR